jgi:hypothetical protein
MVMTSGGRILDHVSAKMGACRGNFKLSAKLFPRCQQRCILRIQITGRTQALDGGCGATI